MQIDAKAQALIYAGNVARAPGYLGDDDDEINVLYWFSGHLWLMRLVSYFLHYAGIAPLVSTHSREASG